MGTVAPSAVVTRGGGGSAKMVAVTDEPATCNDESPARRGRPRSKEFDESILRATLELAGELGINGMSMDEVASRAGVSKATIYRRWPSKEILVLYALQTAVAPLDDVDTGELVEDLRQYLHQLLSKMRTRGRMNDVLPHLIEAATHDPALRSAVDDYIRSRRAPMRVVLERGLERGELPPDVDIEILLDALLGPVLYRRLLSGDVLDDAFIDGLIALVLPAR